MIFLFILKNPKFSLLLKLEFWNILSSKKDKIYFKKNSISM